MSGFLDLSVCLCHQVILFFPLSLQLMNVGSLSIILWVSDALFMFFPPPPAFLCIIFLESLIKFKSADFSTSNSVLCNLRFNWVFSSLLVLFKMFSFSLLRKFVFFSVFYIFIVAHLMSSINSVICFSVSLSVHWCFLVLAHMFLLLCMSC